jgi:hypothetical protein
MLQGTRNITKDYKTRKMQQTSAKIDQERYRRTADSLEVSLRRLAGYQ